MAIRVLVIEDSPTDQELARRALRDVPVPPGPVECVMAGNWRDGETELAAGGADLVLLDYNLPGLSGLDILRELRQRGVETPVIMLTGQQEIDTAVTMLREGARDYVPKSATSGPLLCRTVERVLEQVRLERELADARARLAAYATALEEKVAARTAIVQAQAVEIEELYLRSEEAARLKGETLANVSHELRTPLNVVLGYTDLLQEELAQAGSPQAQDMLRTVRTQADRLHQLVQALLALRAGSGESAPSVARFCLRELRDELCAEAVGLNADKGLTLTLADVPAAVAVVTDREKVRTIAYHLLSNAIKFTHAGEVEVTLAATPGDGLRIAVRDTGIGVPAEAHARIFEDFRQLDGSTTRRFEGLGLGLGIVKRYTALLGGTLAIDSVPGTGTCVMVEIPGSPLPAAVASG